MRSLLSPNIVREIKEKTIKSLRSALSSEENVKTCCKYYVVLRTEEAHQDSHPTKRLMDISQRVHPQLISKIQQLVASGITNAVEMQRLLKNHVQQHLCTGNSQIQMTELIIPLVMIYEIIKNKCSSQLWIKRMHTKLCNGLHLHLIIIQWRIMKRVCYGYIKR